MLFSEAVTVTHHRVYRLPGIARSGVLPIVPLLVGLCCTVLGSTDLALPAVAWGDETDGVRAHTLSDEVFAQFTAHIARQVMVDKEQFAAAEACTHWFYQQLKPKRPQASAQPTTLETSDCRAKYPQGINGARDEMSRTQSSLSLSLTFYEFALVSDRDDNGLYSETEVRDILESFGFTSEPLMPDLLVATLNNKFDAIRKFGGLEPLMTSMGTLYDKGYRFTTQDREALDRILG